MKHLIVTTINQPTPATIALAEGARRHSWEFLVIGDKKSHQNYDLPGARFYSVKDQQSIASEYARLCGTGHYARKNIGYLIAFSEGTSQILETDDDNLPYGTFFQASHPVQKARYCTRTGWLNIYAYFSNVLVWPRGYPLQFVRDSQPSLEELPIVEKRFPIHQGLADDNPDVDAVYRLLLQLPIKFQAGEPVAISATCHCPFNSQNTRWWPEAFPLLYLPFHCSFRMTDIWRSFVAQRILAAQNLGILFHEPTVYQDRNAHDLMKDFQDEIEGYCINATIIDELNKLPLIGTRESVFDDLKACYECLIAMKAVQPQERELLSAWCSDCTRLLTNFRIAA